MVYRTKQKFQLNFYRTVYKPFEVGILLGRITHFMLSFLSLFLHFLSCRRVFIAECDECTVCWGCVCRSIVVEAASWRRDCQSDTRRQTRTGFALRVARTAVEHLVEPVDRRRRQDREEVCDVWRYRADRRADRSADSHTNSQYIGTRQAYTQQCLLHAFHR